MLAFIVLGLFQACAVLAAPDAVAAWMKAAHVDVPQLPRSGTVVETCWPDGDTTRFSFLSSLLPADVAVFGLGEGSHGMAEYPLLRNCFAAHLMLHEGLRAITFESGLIEARIVDDFVMARGAVTLTDALERGFTHHMGPWNETRALVEFVRAFNDAQARIGGTKVRWFGKDLPVTGDYLPAALVPLRDAIAATGAAIADLDTAVATAVTLGANSGAIVDEVISLLPPGVTAIDPDYLDIVTSVSYEALAEVDRAALGDAVRALAPLVSQHATALAASFALTRKQSSDEGRDHVAYIQTLVSYAEQLLEDLENRVAHPKDPTTTTVEKALGSLYGAAGRTPPAIDPRKFGGLNPTDLTDYFLGRRSREVHLARNVGDAAKRFGRVLNFAHNGHVAKVATNPIFDGVAVRDFAEGEFILAEWGDRYTVIATTVGEYRDPQGAALDPSVSPPTTSCADCIEKIALERASLNGKNFALSLRGPDVPDDVAAWLAGVHEMRYQAGFLPAQLSQQFDVLVFVEFVHPGVELSTSALTALAPDTGANTDLWGCDAVYASRAAAAAAAADGQQPERKDSSKAALYAGIALLCLAAIGLGVSGAMFAKSRTASTESTGGHTRV
jgi:erythromycin esterase-like protein